MDYLGGVPQYIDKIGIWKSCQPNDIGSSPFKPTTTQIKFVAAATLATGTATYYVTGSKLACAVVVAILPGAWYAFNQFYRQDDRPDEENPLTKSEILLENNSDFKIDIETQEILPETTVNQIEKTIEIDIDIDAHAKQSSKIILPESEKFAILKDFEQQLRNLDLSQKNELKIIESEFLTFDLGVRGGSTSTSTSQQLSRKLQLLSPYHLILLTHTEQFWTTVSDPYFVKDAAAAITPLNFRIMAEYCINHMAGEKVRALNLLIAALALDDFQLENKLMAIAFSGHPQIDEKAFTFKSTHCRKEEQILSCWKQNQERVTNLWKEESKNSILRQNSTPNRTSSKKWEKPLVIKKPEEQSYKTQKTTRKWSDEEIANFIENILGNHNKNACFNQFEIMDDDSLVRVVKCLGENPNLLEKLWNFERITSNCDSSIQKRKHRLDVILSHMMDIQFKISGELESFWEVAGNNIDRYSSCVAFGASENQLEILMAQIPLNKMFYLIGLIEGFSVPEAESERTVLRGKLAKLKAGFEEREKHFDNLVPFETLRNIQNTIGKKEKSLNIQGL